jgi:hypothetical protein
MILRNLSQADYYADMLGDGAPPSLSASIAKLLVDKSPAHARGAHPRLRLPTDKKAEDVSPSKSVGTLIHRLVLGAGGDIVVIESDDYRTKTARELRDTALAKRQIPVLIGDYEEAKAAADAIKSHSADLGIVLNGESEVAARWTETASDGTVVYCKGMFDHLWEDKCQIVDLKTTRTAEPDAIARDVATYGYAIQQAAYESALRNVGRGNAPTNFIFLFAETEPPYIVTIAQLCGQLRDLGERQWRYAIDAFALCLNRNEWPARYGRGRVLVSAKPWAIQAWEDKVVSA